MKIDSVGASRAQHATSPSGFSHYYSVEAPFNLWYEPLEIVFDCELTPGHMPRKGLIRTIIYLNKIK